MRKFYIEDSVEVGEAGIVFELTKPKGYTEITDVDKIKELYMRQYKYRINDGKEYVLEFTANRYVDILNETYSQSEVFALEAHIKDLYLDLSNGWWLTAQNTNSNLSLSGIYTQVMKDEIQALIDDYVTNNY